VFKPEGAQTGKAGRPVAAHQRRIALAKSNHRAGWVFRKEVAETPYPADVAGIEGESPFSPLPLKGRRVEGNFIDHHLKQIAATWTGKSPVVQVELGPALSDTAS
jgi:hypothetical protein